MKEEKKINNQEIDKLLNEFINEKNICSDSMDGVKVYYEGNVIKYLKDFAEKIKKNKTRECDNDIK